MRTPAARRWTCPDGGAHSARGQALVDLAQHALDTADLPTTDGTRPRLTVVVPWHALSGALPPGTPEPGQPDRQTSALAPSDNATQPDGEDGDGDGGAGPPPAPLPAGVARIVGAGPIDAATARRLACDVLILPVVLASNGQLLDVGTETRTWSRAQRDAVHARSGGTCEAPRCTRRATHVHHLWHWACGGPTCTDNAAHLCTACHWAIHHTSWDLHGHAPDLQARQRPRPGNELAEQKRLRRRAALTRSTGTGSRAGPSG